MSQTKCFCPCLNFCYVFRPRATLSHPAKDYISNKIKKADALMIDATSKVNSNFEVLNVNMIVPKLNPEPAQRS